MGVALNLVFASLWLAVATVAVWLLAATEVGVQLGLRLHRAHDEPRIRQIGAIQGAILGLLALLLGFTFAMAAERYDTRRGLVLDEANALGTTYLRAGLLPDAQGTVVRDLLPRYLTARLEFYDAGEDEVRLAAAEQDAARLQAELWALAERAGRAAPSPIVAAFVVSLNESIDLAAARGHAARTRVPQAVWLLLLVVAAGGCFSTGYAAGASGVRAWVSSLALPLLLAVVMTLIADLDRPRGGLIRISQQPMLDLKAGWSAPGR